MSTEVLLMLQATYMCSDPGCDRRIPLVSTKAILRVYRSPAYDHLEFQCLPGCRSWTRVYRFQFPTGAWGYLGARLETITETAAPTTVVRMRDTLDHGPKALTASDEAMLRSWRHILKSYGARRPLARRFEGA